VRSKNREALVAYVASPHAGYLQLFRAYQGGLLYVLGREFVVEHQRLVRHLPANEPRDVVRMVRALGIFSHVHELTKVGIRALPPGPIIMPDEDVSHAVAQAYFADREVRYDSRWKLRWDWGASQKNERPQDERVVSTAEFDREIMHRVADEASRSSDWWRQVGCALVKDGKILFVAFNKHMPSEQTAYLMGDPRSNFDQGASIEVSIANHAERRVQAEAARRGISTEGCDLYVTTFPCPPCAYAWAESGICRLYYRDGYSNLEGAHALLANGIELVRVEMHDAPAAV